MINWEVRRRDYSRYSKDAMIQVNDRRLMLYRSFSGSTIGVMIDIDGRQRDVIEKNVLEDTVVVSKSDITVEEFFEAAPLFLQALKMVSDESSKTDT